MVVPRRSRLLSFFAMTVMVIFIVVEFSRNINQGRNNDSISKIRIPNKRFWITPKPQAAYWNLKQQILDHLNNPILNGPSGAINTSLPDWVNQTMVQNSCEPDFGVARQVKDYSALPSRFKDFLLYMQCRTYPMLVDLPHICQDNPFLLVAVKSLVPNFDRRQAIRQSWGKAGLVANRTVVTVFLLGTASTEDHFPDLTDMLKYEHAMHRDILQWDYRDTFFNLTVKEVLFLKWVSSRCPGAHFIFKGDDDVFVNTLRIIDLLKNLSPTSAKDLFLGDVLRGATPHRDKKLKYFIPESVYQGAYPPYAGGGGYLLSGNLAKRLHGVTDRVALYPIDDVFTGMCMMKLGIAPTSHKGFRTFDILEKYRHNPCAYKGLILVHPRTPQDVIRIWNWVTDTTIKC